MPLLDRDGVNIYYETHGDGPAILLTHGYSATSQMWGPQVAALSENHTLITWDMRGHGRSDSPADADSYSEALTTADMAALLDHLGFASAIIGGLSLGGYMSLAFNVDYPARVEALLIIDTGPGFRKDEAREAWNRTAEARAADLEARGFAALEGRSPEQAEAEHREVNGLVMAARYLLTQRNPRVIASLPDIAVPALVLAGSEDTPFLKATDYMAAKIPGARKVVIEHAGHASNLDQPAAFNAAVCDFIESTGH